MATGQGRAPVAALDDMSLPTGGPDWLSQLREQAQLALSSSGLPDKGWEHWRHNNLAAFAGRQPVSYTHLRSIAFSRFSIEVA